jgi:uncharacterized membrane protein YkvA (DUF1232 family)
MNYRYLRDLHAGNPVAIARLIVHLPNLLKLYWRLLRDRRVNLVPKLILVGAVVYLISPLDFLQDVMFIGVGWIADLILLAVAASAFIRLCPPRVVQEHVELIDQGG